MHAKKKSPMQVDKEITGQPMVLNIYFSCFS